MIAAIAWASAIPLAFLLLALGVFMSGLARFINLFRP